MTYEQYNGMQQSTDVPAPISVPKGWVQVTIANRLRYGTHAARPSASAVDDTTLYIETDTGVIYQAQSSAWVNVTPNVSTALTPAALGVLLGGIQDTYVSSYLTRIDMSKYTHFLYNDVNMSATGTFAATNTTNMESVVTAAHAAGIKAGILLDTQTNLSHVVSDHLADAVTNLTTFMTTYNLDFVVVDDEVVAVTQAEMESFLHAIDTALTTTEIIIAVGWYVYKITTTTFTDHCDYLWVMAYDMVIPNGLPFHSTVPDALSTMRFWIDGGYTASKLLMGIPFYAKDGAGTAYIYRTLMSDLNPPPDVDIVYGATVPDGLFAYFNGVTTVRKKIDYARYLGLGGIGVFDSAQDLLDNHTASLMLNIANENTVALPVQIADILYEQHIVSDASKNSASVTGTGKAAQTFTPSSTHFANMASLCIYRNAASTGKLVVEIQATTAGEPNGSVLASGFINLGGLEDAKYRRVDVDLGAGVVLTSGTMYALVWYVSNGGTVYYYYDNTGFANGAYWTYTPSTWTQSTGNDCWFQIWNKLPTSPTPASLLYQNNYTAPKAGEIRTISGNYYGGSIGLGISLDNPFRTKVRVLSVDLEITTQSAASGTLCVGVGSVYNTDYATMFSVQPCDLGTSYPYLRNSTKTATYGVQTNPINWDYGTGNRYLNFYNHAATTGLVLKWTITVMGE